MPAELRGAKVWVQDQSEANRIYNKGRFGRPRSGGSLELDLVEAAYLLEKDRLSLEGRSIPEFYVEASRAEPEFVVRFIAYRELREKGLMVQLAHGELAEHGFHYWLPDLKKEGKASPHTYVAAASERASVRVRDLVGLAARCQADGRDGLVIVVDEESDTTTYEIGRDDPRGKTPASSRFSGVASFQVDRSIVWDADASRRLHEAEFFGRRFTNGLHASLVETLHLAARGLRILDPRDGKPLSEAQLWKTAKRIEPGIESRSRVYEDLKERALVVKTGYKFGTHFRAYESDPEGSHAPYLVHVVDREQELEWPLLSRAVRLAHGVRKTLLLAVPQKEGVEYVRLRRSK